MKEKYEISIWQDVLVKEPNIPAHYEEKKLLIIGSNTMDENFRAFKPRLVENVNGTNTFTFEVKTIINEFEINKFYQLLYDKEDEEVRDSEGLQLACSKIEFGENKYQNPIIQFLNNETKIKVFWKDKWYDLIVKNCQEDSSNKTIIYTCKDAYIDELSKTGFNIEFNDDLQNNQGTAAELSGKVLSDTDWGVDEENSDKIRQLVEEAVYETILSSDNVEVYSQTKLETQTITRGPVADEYKVLVFYQQLEEILKLINNNKQSGISDIQFLYNEGYSFPTDEGAQLVIDTDCFCIKDCQWKIEEGALIFFKVKNQIEIPYFGFSINFDDGAVIIDDNVSENYRGKRYVDYQKTVLDKLTNKYCSIYTYKAPSGGDTLRDGHKIYGYTEEVFNDATIVNNLLINNKDFTSINGWTCTDESIVPIFKLYPEPEESTESYAPTSYLRLGSLENNKYYKNGPLGQSINYIPLGFIKGESYIFKCRAFRESSSKPNLNDKIVNGDFTFSIRDKNNNVISNTPTRLTGLSNDYLFYRVTFTDSYSREEIIDKEICLCINPTRAMWIQEVEFFPEKYGTRKNEQGRDIRVLINPGEMDISSVHSTRYIYYDHTEAEALGITNLSELTYLYTSDSAQLSFLIPDMSEDNQKVRSINGKQTNRFNLLQTIAETFECWIQFNVEHNANGSLVYENGVPKKYITIKENVGKQLPYGFRYGDDLKSVTRTIETDQITTKTIVLPNSNEFAQDKICSIARSKENYPRVNFILNFNYYIKNGLINGEELYKDLYDTSDPEHFIGYYYNLHKINNLYDELNSKIVANKNELNKKQSFYEIYSGYLTATETTRNQYQADLISLANATSVDDDRYKSYISQYYNTDQVKNKLVAIANLNKKIVEYTTLKSSLETSINLLDQDIKTGEAQAEIYVNNIKDLDLRFYKKYSRFIKEGSWIDEKYMDNDLYFLDAQSVAYTSAFPKVSYNISVMRLSGIEGFENKKFGLGDISYIIDTDFFGYVKKSGKPDTPYKEKVVITEYTSNFDEPQNDSITVQNYRSQFETLFQKITASAQSLQYSQGEYAKAANIIDEDGNIDSAVLQAAFNKSANLVRSAQNDTYIQDNTGITVTDSLNPNKKTKISSGGIFITSDGGATWKNAIHGEGIATEQLTAGVINTQNIHIFDGSTESFRWDQNGITAINNGENEQGKSFVRFDKHGIYGVNDDAAGKTGYEPWDISDIKDKAQFGVLWDGFFIKHKDGNHSVEISNTEDFIVKYNPNNVNLIQIGKIEDATEGTDAVYGIKFRDVNGNTTLKTDNNGKLWLENYLTIGNIDNTVTIGVTDNDDGTNKKVINANDKFIVYEDGSIHAKSGTIGNVTIDSIEKSSYDVKISSSAGTVVKDGGATSTTTLTAKLYQGDTEIKNLPPENYTWYQDYSSTSVTGSTYDFDYRDDFSTTVFECKITYNGATYSNTISIAKVKDGSGQSYYTFVKYAEDERGASMGDIPGPDKPYIGFCTTSNSTAPDDPTSYTWSKYLGSSGIGIDSIQTDYAVGEDGTTIPEVWRSTIPEVPKGQYLWVRNTCIYTNGASTVSYSVSYQGENGEAIKYRIDSEDTILKFYKLGEREDKNKWVFAPEPLYIYCFKDDEKITNAYVDVEVRWPTEESGRVPSIGRILSLRDELDGAKVITGGARPEETSALEVIFSYAQAGTALKLDLTTWTLPTIPEPSEAQEKVEKLYKTMREKTVDIVLKLYKSNELIEANLADVKTVKCAFDIPEDFAKLTVSSKTISQIVGNKEIDFSTDGLSVYNSDIKVYSTPKSSGAKELVFGLDSDRKNFIFNGKVIAETGTIANWDIGSTPAFPAQEDKGKVIHSLTPDGRHDAGMKTYINNLSNKAFYVASTDDPNPSGAPTWDYPFYVTYDGELHATRAIIEAQGASKIGQWTIEDNGALLTDVSDKDKNSAAIGVFNGGSSTFYVTKGGILHAEEAHIQGTIEADKGYFKRSITVEGKPLSDWLSDEGNVKKIEAKEGSVGGWKITGTEIHAETTSNKTGKKIGTGLQVPWSGINAIAVGYTDSDNWASAPFYVTHEGEMHAKAGTIGRWYIDAAGLWGAVIDEGTDYILHLTPDKVSLVPPSGGPSDLSVTWEEIIRVVKRFR